MVTAKPSPFVSSPTILKLSDLDAYSELFSRAFIVYGTLLGAVVKRPWPSKKQRETQDKFWARFR